MAYFVSNFLENVADLTTLNILRTTRAMLMRFCTPNTPRCQILIWVCKLFCLFQQFLACEKVILLKDRKLQLWSIFHCQDILKNRPLSEIMFPSNSVTSWKFWLVMYKEWFVLKKDHYHHEKFSSLMYMLFRKYNMVRDFSCKLMYMTVYIFELCT